MKKKLLSVVLCGVMAAALLAGCGKRSAKTELRTIKTLSL